MVKRLPLHAQFMGFGQYFSLAMIMVTLSFLTSGCGAGTAGTPSENENQETSSNDEGESASTPKTTPGDKGGSGETDSETLEIGIVDLTAAIQKIQDTKPTRSLEGRWHLRVRQEIQELATSLFEIKKEKNGKLAIKALELPLQGWEFRSGNVAKNNVEIKISTGNDGDTVFNGTLYDDVVIGSFQFPTGESLPARLTSTKDKSMDGKAVGLNFDNFDEFSGAYDEPDAKTSIAKLFQFAKKHPLNPLTLQAYIFILRQAKSPSAELTDDDVLTLMKNLAATAKLWGKPRVLGAFTGALGTILDQGYKPETLIAVVNSARSELGETLSDSDEVAIFDYAEGRALLQLEDTAQIEKGVQLLKSNPDEGFLKLFCNFELARFAKKKNDQKLLESLLEENPLDPSLMYVLGQIADEKMDYQKALDYYSVIASLPGLEGVLREIWTSEGVRIPSAQILSRNAWMRIHKTEEGFNEHLNKAYDKHIYSFTKSEFEVPTPAKNQKTVLVELLTGSSCPPCVAADVALGGIEQSIPDTARMIALRYHFHNPAPDPLTVREGQFRYNYYESRSDSSEGFGTPTFFVNGKRTTQVGGSLLNVSSTFQVLLEEIKPELAATTPVTLKADAAINDNTLSLSASATGFPKENENLKLRIVLAQKSVSYKSRNGVRTHEMLVRDMPGGAAGISPKDGKLEFATEIAFDDMIGGMREYLSKVEQGMGIIFPVRPVEVKELQLVAFVQDDKTLEVLQTIHVPVEGDFVVPVETDESSDSAESNSKKPETDAPANDDKKKEGPALKPTESTSPTKSEDQPPESSAVKESEPNKPNPMPGKDSE